MRRRYSRIGVNLLLTALSALVAIVFAFPILWVAIMSLQDAATSASLPPKFIFTPTFDTYVKLFEVGGFSQAIVNSTVITVGTTLLALVIGTTAGYALARFELRVFGSISFTILGVRMLPGFAAVVPLFVILRNMGLFGGYEGVVIAGALGGACFVAWMMRAYFAAIPTELDDAAMIDGCSRLRAIWSVILPIAMPGLVATTVITAIGAWNEFLFVLILGGEKSRNMQVVLANLITNERAEWGMLAAGGVLTMFPAIIFGLMVRQYFFSGMGAGSIKG